MPSTYTVNLGIQKPATGEQSGTWGNTTNANFDILDQGINGAIRLTLTSAGSSGSPNALAINEGSVSDGHNKWIEFYSSSDLGGNVFVQLTPNDAEKIVFVRNSLAGSRSVLLFQGTYNAGRDLEIPAGVDMVVKFSGGGANAATVTDVYTKLRATEITTPSLTATTADINGGTIDNSVIGGSTAAAVTGTAIVANTSLNIAGDGATVTGIKDEDNMASNSATKLATQQSIKAYVDSQVGTVDTLSEVLANGNTTGGTDIAVSANDDITFTDSSRAKFGASSDLVIFHDGSNSYIQDNGTGDLILRGSSNISLQAAGGTVGANFAAAAAVTLNHAGNQKLATTSTGINVTGTVEFDGLSGTGAVTVTDILDEDNMASNSATKLATQQSIKAYVDAEVAGIPTGDITSVIAGTGLTGGGTSGAVTLNVTTLNQNTTGNAATATALQTARTIAGVSFNGTANISLNNNAITNGAGYTTNTGDITGVTAGTQLTGGGTSGTVTINLSQGSGSGLDADTLDGIQGASYLRSDASDTFTGTLTMAGQLQMNGNIINDVEDIYLRDKLYHDADTDTYMGFATNTVNFLTGGTNRLQIDDSQVTASGELQALRLRATSTGDASLSSTTHGLQIGPTSSNNIAIDGNEILARNNGAASSLILQNDGGALSACAGGGTATFGGAVVVPSQIIHAGDTNTYIQFHAADQFRVVAAGNERFEVRSDGVLVSTTLTATGDVIAYGSSDKQLKDNIKPIANAMDKISKLSGNTFDWNDKQSEYHVGTKDVGVIAQEVEAVLPEVVTTRDNGYKAVRYEKMIALLIEGMKEQQAEIDTLKAKLGDM